MNNSLEDILEIITRLQKETGEDATITFSSPSHNELRITVAWKNYDFTVCYSAHINNLIGMSNDDFVSFFSVYIKSKFRSMLNIRSSMS